MDLNVPSSSLRRGGVVLWDGRLLRELNGPKDLLDQWRIQYKGLVFALKAFMLMGAVSDGG
ncbi:hypothetical protein F2Q70_00027084 [Brassica cretica]|uniref:Uncharacterized protein n=1 Tax=Brassica cretica TaxID=69181 RepID=A0A8S9LD76_BRACR|nr:hypothetical protein F2Q70_00027084 [Brassica cretica]